MASIPDIASLPKMVLAAAVCSASLSPAKEDRRFLVRSIMVFMVPSVLVMEIFRSSITAACFSVGADRLASAVFKVVPAWLALMPLLAISPKLTAASWAE